MYFTELKLNGFLKKQNNDKNRHPVLQIYDPNMKTLFYTIISDQGKKPYTVKIEFDTKKDPTVLNLKELKVFLQNTNLKVDCDCESFLLQGFRYKCTKLNAAIIPELRPDPRWRTYNRGMLTCKHISSVLKQVMFISPVIYNKMKKFKIRET